jgi:chromate transporter
VPNLRNLAEVGGAFLRLGFTSFGGAIAHLGYFRTEFVERRRWLDDATYADTVALCQFLPGPASSQVAFLLGMRRAGIAGALTASFCFMLPSTVAMIAFAYGMSSLGDLRNAGWLHGLKLTAVAVVAVAVWQMGTRLCPDWPRRILALMAAAAVLMLPEAFCQMGVIAACALAGYWIYRVPQDPTDAVTAGLTRGHAWAAASLLFFALLFVFLSVAANTSPSRAVAEFDGFYRAGSLTFGGGHVVLPLLRSVVIPPGWTTDNVFLAGYGAAQALPGPLFTFACFLGTVTYLGSHAWMGGLLGLIAIYLPGFLLAGGAYPFWHLLRFRARPALIGANAAVVGILLAALYRPLCTEAIGGTRDTLVIAAAILLLVKLRFPPWALVALMAAAGQWVL